MTRDAWAHLDQLTDGRPLPAAEPKQGLGDGGDAGVLGQEISHRLFSAGLDLDFALSLDGVGPAADRLRHAAGRGAGHSPVPRVRRRLPAAAR